MARTMLATITGLSVIVFTETYENLIFSNLLIPTQHKILRTMSDSHKYIWPSLRRTRYKIYFDDYKSGLKGDGALFHRSGNRYILVAKIP
jgi:hypothetical protein